MVSDHLAHTVVEAIDEVVCTLMEEADDGETRISMDPTEDTETEAEHLCSGFNNRVAIQLGTPSISSTENHESAMTVREGADPVSSETSL